MYYVASQSEMVRKELYVYLLAYNLLRTLMWEAGTTYSTLPLRLSLQATRQHLDNFIPQLLITSGNKRRRIREHLTSDDCTQTCPRTSGAQRTESQKAPPSHLIL